MAFAIDRQSGQAVDAPIAVIARDDTKSPAAPLPTDADHGCAAVVVALAQELAVDGGGQREADHGLEYIAGESRRGFRRQLGEWV